MESVHAVRRYVNGRLLATRQGTILLGIGAAALAAIVIVAYVNQYRQSLSAGAAPAKVLVADGLIEKGMLGDTIALKKQYTVASVPKDELKTGAITDPAALRGRVAVADVLPGQQLTGAEFALGESTLGTQLVDEQRAIAVPVGATAGNAGQVEAGDRVDVYASFSEGDLPDVVKTLLQDVYVIQAPVEGQGGVGGAEDSRIVLRVTPKQAAKLAFVADNGSIWVVLRPRAGAPKTNASTVTFSNVLLGSGK
ncbi:MAG: Flp pilus assembly protein CpaB [Thermoleophilia bacterium]|nr:Flp pilus assembly protein CpaB [Thermoleophilia bacterium]